MAISWPMSYPKESTLFVEGQEPTGIFLLSEGRVKLSMNSADAKSIMVRIAEPGELLGLPATISGNRYELTAQTLEPVRANFVPRVAFLQFLRDHGVAAVRVAHSLSDLYRSTLLEVRYLGFSGSATEKLARFLMDLPARPSSDNGHLWVRLPLTHKEIGEMIGTSRETVTRLFGHFKRRRLIEVHNSTLLITNENALRAIFDSSF